MRNALQRLTGALFELLCQRRARVSDMKQAYVCDTHENKHCMFNIEAREMSDWYESV